MNELDPEISKAYNRLTFHEFLEFIGRVVDKSFEESELVELSLDEKLEYILPDLLHLVGFKYT